MPVFNAERLVRRAVESIVEQTYTDWQLLVVDDGSTDGTRAAIEAVRDPRIAVVSRENRGLVPSLNEALALADSELVARQDADDISLPTRLEREVAFLDANPDVALVGTNYTVIDEDEQPLGTTSVFTHPDDLAVAMVLSNQYGHGSVMMRRAVAESVGGYDASVGHVEDYDLFVRISHVAKIANIAEPLYLWRRTPTSISESNRSRQAEQTFAIRDREFARLLRERKRYRLFSSIHPTGFRPSRKEYFAKKAMLFRDLAYMYRLNGRRRMALATQVAALVVAPWQRRNVRQFVRLVRDGGREPLWDYEFL
jgi:glycosyltransferase involved in cell wall biosynthesis